MTHMLSTYIIFPNKSQPFSIVWVDDTGSICDLPCLLTYLDNHANNHHKADATWSPTTNRNFRRSSMVWQPLPPSHLPPLSHRLLSFSVMLLRQYPWPAPSGGVFPGIHSCPDLVDRLTRSGSFAFLIDLFDMECLFELRDFRIVRVMPKGESVEQLETSVNLVLDLIDKYPRDSLATHILDCVAQFLPAFLCPYTRRGRVRQIISKKRQTFSVWWVEGPVGNHTCVCHGEKLTLMLNERIITLNVIRHLFSLG